MRRKNCFGSLADTFFSGRVRISIFYMVAELLAIKILLVWLSAVATKS